MTKAALVAGRDGAGENGAISTTPIRTAILNGVDPQAWLCDALERMLSDEIRSSQLATLLPWNGSQPGSAAAA